MYRQAPALARLGTTQSAPPGDLSALSRIGGALSAAPFESLVSDYYLTNPVARASAVMAELSRFQALAAEREARPVIEKKHG
jgi:NADH-quinone oxidoreductase subunit G